MMSRIIFGVAGLLLVMAAGARGEERADGEVGKKGREVIGRVVEECGKIRSGWVEFGGVMLTTNPFPEEGEEDPVQHFTRCHWGTFIFDEAREGFYAESWERRMNDAPPADATRLMTGDPYQNLKSKSDPPEESLSVLQRNREYFASYQERRLSRRPAPVEERMGTQLHLWPADKKIEGLLVNPPPIDPRACGLIHRTSLDFWGISRGEPLKFHGDQLRSLEVRKVSDEGGLIQVEMSDPLSIVMLTVDAGKGYRPVRLVRASKPDLPAGNANVRIESQVTWVEVGRVWVPKTFRWMSRVVGQKWPVQDLTIEFRWSQVNQRIDYDVFEFHSLEVVQRGATVVERRGLTPKVMGLWDGKGRLAPYPDEVGEEVVPKELKVMPAEVGR